MIEFIIISIVLIIVAYGIAYAICGEDESGFCSITKPFK